MKTLPQGWELACMQQALTSAGFAFAERRGSRGAPMLSFNYGPSPGEQVWMSVQCGPGAMVITAHNLLSMAQPSAPQLAAANDVNIDWPFGKLFWLEGAFSSAVALFAYPDWPPLGSDVRIVCHALWQARHDLSQLRPSELPAPPPGPPLAELVQIISQATRVPFREKDGRWITRLDAGDGTCGLTLMQTTPATYLFDVMPLNAAPWPEDLDSWKRLNGVSARLLRGAATRWQGGRVIVRETWLPPLLVTDHAEWAGLALDHAISAAELVTRESKRP